MAGKPKRATQQREQKVLSGDRLVYSIDRGMPVPVAKSEMRLRLYPWDQMEIGDSFFVPRKETTRAISAAANRKRRYPDFNYTSRSEADGTRFWLIARQAVPRLPTGVGSASANEPTIGRGIPVPRYWGRDRVKSYLWENMKIGDSFWVAAEAALHATSAAAQQKKRHPDFNYVSRREGLGTRIWRVAVQS